VQEGDWTLGPVDESAVPAADKARAAFVEAKKTCVIGQAACTGAPYPPPINFCRVIVSCAAREGCRC